MFTQLMHGTQLVGSLIAALGFLLSSIAAGHALLRKRRPQSAFGWIGLSYALPFVGPLLYFLFGINRVRTKAQRLRGGRPETLCPPSDVAMPPAGLESLARLGFAVTQLPLVGGNSIEILHNGEHAFPAMLAAIRSARAYLYFSTYILDSGHVGKEFAAALGDARDRGVDVRVLLDGVGELYSWPPARDLLTGRGLRVERFVPPRLVPPSFSVNLRNHRKILTADGEVAFTGGVNIRDHYLSPDPETPAPIVDMHFRFTGPITAQIEAIFLADWELVTGEIGAAKPFTGASSGKAICRTLSNSPEGDLDRLTETLVGAIGNAKRRVAIMTPYFLPPRELIAPLQAAALQGVDVAVILPEQNNLPYVHRATRHMLWELLQRGVRIYYQPPPFVHSKLFYFDDEYAQVGSANLDPRSLRLNFEMNVEVYDRAFVAELARHFEAVRSSSTAITLGGVDGRSVVTKIIDGVCWLFSPYL
jgi:cardiolipin synthase A/B